MLVLCTLWYGYFDNTQKTDYIYAYRTYIFCIKEASYALSALLFRDANNFHNKVKHNIYECYEHRNVHVHIYELFVAKGADKLGYPGECQMKFIS